MKKCRNLPYRKCFAKSDIAAKNRSLQGKAQNKLNYYIKTPAQLNVGQEIYPILNSKFIYREQIWFAVAVRESGVYSA